MWYCWSRSRHRARYNGDAWVELTAEAVINPERSNTVMMRSRSGICHSNGRTLLGHDYLNSNVPGKDTNHIHRAIRLVRNSVPSPPTNHQQLGLADCSIPDWSKITDCIGCIVINLKKDRYINVIECKSSSRKFEKSTTQCKAPRVLNKTGLQIQYN